MENQFIEKYKKYVNKGSDIHVAYYVVASSIASRGEIEDLRKLTKIHESEIDRVWEEVTNK